MGIVIYNSRVAKLVNDLVMPIDAITIFPFIFVVRDYMSGDTFRHETIHLSQQLECLLIGFYFLYALEYVVGRLRGLDHIDAYLRIGFEREAYGNQSDKSYCRKPFAWIHYTFR
jgi:hypothetical protein